ncbi:MAG TPA: hypothetical protein VLJ39_05510 [Tepidisphaeraceae bacterium]|nr:hypothetical protein [Tepidisphaeraceae bacterium]
MSFTRHWLLFAASALLIGVSFGCQGRSTIPSDAAMVNSGSGGPISYTADRDGDAYVLDSNSNEKVFEGQMHRGDQLVVEPGRDRIVLGGNSADHKVSLRGDHNYKIYFTPAR